jgi:hypothetical protein
MSGGDPTTVQATFASAFITVRPSNARAITSARRSTWRRACQASGGEVLLTGQTAALAPELEAR